MKTYLAAVLSGLLVALALSVSQAAAQVPGLTISTPAAQAGEASDPSLDELIRILESDAARAKLVESLKAAAYRSSEADTAAEEDVAAAGWIGSLPDRVAGYGAFLLEGAAVTLASLSQAFSEARDLLAGTSRLDLPDILSAILPVASVAVVAVAVLLAGHFATDRALQARIGRREKRGPLRKLLLLAVLILADVAAVVLAWAAGYVVAALVTGTGGPSLDQAAFLDAFLTVELIRAGLSGLIAPHHPALRLTPFGDHNASYWYSWLSRLLTTIGYSFLFVAPLVERSSSAAAAEAVRFIIAAAALLLVLSLIVRNREPVRLRLGRRLAAGETGAKARVYSALGAVWHIVALVYVLALFVAWLVSPREGLPFIVGATLVSLAAMVAGGLVVSVISRIMARGITIPTRTKERLPLLERHINSFVPGALTVLRTLVIAAVIGAILDAWAILDLGGWAGTATGQRFVGGLAGACLVLLLAFAVFLVVSSWIEYRLNPNFGRIPTARERTLLALFRNGFTATLAVLAVMLVLSQLGIDIAPLLAGAGVVGLAVGFGAQKLVQDVITGAFIQLENAMNEGDVVQVAGISGVVERLTIRSVALRSVEGTYHLIPFSSVTQVSNMTKDFSHFVADVSVAYRENIAAAKEVMRDAFDLVRSGHQGEHIISDFEMMGVERLADSAVVVRGRIKTRPGKQWEIGRAYNEILKRLCDERGIELPFPQTTIWFGEGKNGRAAPLRIDALPNDAPLAQTGLEGGGRGG